MPLLIVAVALLGLAVGSFLNVVIHRVPRSDSLVRPASSCPACGHTIRHRHNVPVLSWLVLRGRCADCAAPISVRYPAVELLTAALFVAVAVRLAEQDLLAALPAFLLFSAGGVALAAIDLDVGRLPNSIVLPAYPVLAVLLAGAAWWTGAGSLWRCLVGAAATYAVFYALAVARPGGMGFGDVKLAGLVGGVLGFLSFPVLLVGLAAAFATGATIGVVAMLRGRATSMSRVPFGPFLVGGALLAILAGTPIADLYTRLAFAA